MWVISSPTKRGDADERGIYGEATGEEVSDLIEEEIDVLPLPGRNRKNS